MQAIALKAVPGGKSTPAEPEKEAGGSRLPVRAKRY
jgi:hypothetical protein